MASQNDIAAAEAEFKKKFGGMGGGMKPQWVLKTLEIFTVF